MSKLVIQLVFFYKKTVNPELKDRLLFFYVFN